MEYLLVMSLSGSAMMGIYLLLKYLLKDKVSSRLYYLILQEAVLFFLIPLPFLKDWYRKIILPAIPEARTKEVQIPVAWTKYVIHVGGKEYVNTYAVIQMAVVAVWLLIVCILMGRLLLKYLRIRRLVLKSEGTEMTEKQRLFLAELKRQYGVRRPVFLCQGQDRNHTKTFGICRPVIICDKQIESWEAEIHVRHEMVHIKRLDVLWKMLTRLAVMLHWWNPAAWMLRREFERVCEYSCDEIVMQGKTREEIKVYLRLLIDEACAAVETEADAVTWQNSFADDVENMKARIRNLIKKKKWNRYAAGMLAAVLAFGNSWTVFAYRDTLHQEISANASWEEVAQCLRVDMVSFTPDGAEEERIKDFEWAKMDVFYEKQFIGSEGTIYPYSDAGIAATYRNCGHRFVSGTLLGHTGKSDGRCEVAQYHAQKCGRCDHIVRGKRIQVCTYEKCPH